MGVSQIGIWAPHYQDARIAVQGLSEHLQRRLCLLLHVLYALGYILGVEKGGYAVVDTGAQLMQGQRGVGDEGIWKWRGRLHCDRRANVDMRDG